MRVQHLSRNLKIFSFLNIYTSMHWNNLSIKLFLWEMLRRHDDSSRIGVRHYWPPIFPDRLQRIIMWPPIVNSGCRWLWRPVSLDWALLEYDLRPVNACNKIIIAIWAIDIEEFHLLLRLVIAVDNAISIVIHNQGTTAKEGTWWKLVVAIVTPLWDNVCSVC